MRFLSQCLFSVVLMLSVSLSVLAEEQPAVQTIGLLPFSVSDAGSFAYLEEAARQMLVTRLSGTSGVQVITPMLPSAQVEQLKKQLYTGKYRDVARQLQVDWVADGALLAQGEGLRVVMELFPQQEGRTQQHIENKAANVDAVLPAMTQVSAAVATAVGIMGSKGADVPAVAEPQPAGADTKGLTAFETPHPERNYKKGVFTGATVAGGGDDRFQSRGVRRSAPVPMETEAMVLGDLDGDGVNDLIVASRSEVRIFHFAEERFRQVAVFEFPSTIKINVINIGDPGDSGKQLLFVSANKGMVAASAIFSWDGSSRLQAVAQDLDWFVRPILWPGEGVLLVGQQAAGSGSIQYLSEGVFRLALDRQTGKITRQERLTLPKETNLFDFVVADFNGDSENEMVVIDGKQRLLLYDAALSLIWVSSANYGGSLRFFGPPLTEKEKEAIVGNTKTDELRILTYIPGRLDVKDVTGDGIPELVIVSNEIDMISKYLPNIRAYDGGTVACLGWRGSGLVELWRTSHITGYVADYVFEKETSAPKTSAGSLSRLYVAQLPEKGLWRRFLPGGDETVILAYEMRINESKPQ